MPEFIAFQNNPAIKAKFLRRAIEHRRADMFVQGVYQSGNGDNFRGCHIGCLAHGDASTATGGRSQLVAVLVDQMRVPNQLVDLQEWIFENLPAEKAPLWSESLIDSIPVGAVLDHVWPRMAVRILTDPERGVLAMSSPPRDVADAVLGVADCYRDVADGRAVAGDRWEAAAWAACAVRDACAAWAAWAACAVRDACAVRADRAACAACVAWAAWGAWDAYPDIVARWLMAEMSAAPIPGQRERVEPAPHREVAAITA